MGLAVRYTSTDCFETFPLPHGWENSPALEAAGKAYYEYRAALMIKNGQGLTKTYNRFHDPNEPDLEIARLRELQSSMDRVVLEAYGWHDITASSRFVLDSKNEEGDTAKNVYRYRWADETRDAVRARLLDLNIQRAMAEGTNEALNTE
jgi:hypothetical protein